jgi:hypothetical protein
MPRPPDGASLARLRAIVGDGGHLDAPADTEATDAAPRNWRAAPIPSHGGSCTT